MKPNKKLFNRRNNSFYNYKTGAYQKQRSAFNFVLPIMFLVVLGSLAGTGYWVLNTKVVNARQDGDTKTIEKAEQAQNKFGEQSYTVREDEKLAEAILKKTQSMPASTEWAVSVRDLKTGRMANVNSDKIMPSASLYKLFLLAPLEKKLPADNWRIKINRFSVNECVIAMLKVSDNDCADALAGYSNWNKIDSINSELGFKNTKINKQNSQTTTTRDVAELMYRLQTSKILSDKGRRTVFDALYEQKYRDGIPAGCGEQCLVANKTGEIDNIKNDAAIVSHSGGQYVVVIMSKNTSWKQVAEVASFVDRELMP